MPPPKTCSNYYIRPLRSLREDLHFEAYAAGTFWNPHGTFLVHFEDLAKHSCWGGGAAVDFSFGMGSGLWAWESGYTTLGLRGHRVHNLINLGLGIRVLFAWNLV